MTVVVYSNKSLETMMNATPAARSASCGLCRSTRTAVTLDTGFGHYYRCCDCFHTWFRSRHTSGATGSGEGAGTSAEA